MKELLDKLKEIKNNIRQALTRKGATISDEDSFASYSDKLRKPTLLEGYVGDSITYFFDSSSTAPNNKFTTYRKNLKYINLPNVTALAAENSIYNNDNLEEVNLPSVTAINNDFHGRPKLKKINLSSLQSIGTYVFSNCPAIETIIFGSLVSWGNNTELGNFTNLKLLDFSNQANIPTLNAANAFPTSGNYKIKVPFELCDEWKEATNWNTYADFIDGGVPATLHFPNNLTVFVNGKQIPNNYQVHRGNLNYLCIDNSTQIISSGTINGITEGANIQVTVDTTNNSKITLATGVPNLVVQFVLNGNTVDAEADGLGNYSIKVAGADVTLNYIVQGGTSYFDKYGTIITTGQDITESVTMQSATTSNWTRPDLSTDGTIGGSNFATKNTTYSSGNAYRMFDKDPSTYAVITSAVNEVVLYSPTDLNITELNFYNSSTNGDYLEVFVSYDGTEWTEILNKNYINKARCSVLLGNNHYYAKYYKLVVHVKNTLNIYNLGITATYKS